MPSISSIPHKRYAELIILFSMMPSLTIFSLVSAIIDKFMGDSILIYYVPLKVLSIFGFILALQKDFFQEAFKKL